ncbi:helix-turn-helix transcriptional regulator [Runella sp. SP2]|uniref:helix-turn-helix transcriptional regulator n=1 Tax=Runella sp. SP2 TaxID=2268026 RepID=UPI000F0881C6|nr:AraC family transcriptional regulator [Runella sp. SP2]AYQ32960.1 AraC family transcriptional regulator [Runella sp. SP2]
MNTVTITTTPLPSSESELINIVISESDSSQVLSLLIEHRIPFSCIHSEIKLFPNSINTLSPKNLPSSTDETHLFKDEFIEKIQQLHEQIVSDFSFRIPPIDEVSSSFKVSPSKFKSVFKSLYQTPYHQYFMEHKMQQARELLESGQYSVKQVSDLLGYTTPIKFVIVFKKYQKVTPGRIKVNARFRK